MVRLPDKDYEFSSIIYMFDIHYYPWPESVDFTEDEIWTTSEVRFIPMDIYTENNNVNIYINFAEMNKPPRN